MQEQIKQLKRENQDLRDLLQDVDGVLENHKRDFGMNGKEIHARVKSSIGGVKYNAKDFDVSDKNGEQ